MSVPGTIVAWGGIAAKVPPGWLLCDGSAVAISDYPALHSAIGSNFGISSDPDLFYLPDLRGRFLRGVDNGSGHDPDAGKRTDSQSTGTVIGDSVGSLQGDALQEHQHSYTVFPGTDGNIASGDYWAQTASETWGISDGTRTSSETRPVNVAVHFIIQWA